MMNDTKISRANLISLIGMPKFRETHNVHNLSHTHGQKQLIIEIK